MEALALNFAHNMAKALLPKLGGFLAQEAGLLAGVDDDMRYLIDELESIASFLWGLSESQLHDKQVKTWMKQVRELAYDAEDCVDEFIHRYGRPYEQDGLKRCFIRTSLQLKTLFRSHTIATDLKNLKLQAEQISVRRQRYNLVAGGAGGVGFNGIVEFDRLSALFPEEDKLVDIMERSHELEKWVKGSQAELGVFSIYGHGGLGKTTVAKHVFERQMATTHFHCQAWITVSRSFQIEELLQQMLKELCSNYNPPSVEKGVSKLLDAIQKHLKDKRYVIVLDDLWTLSAWDTIKLALLENQRGSRIIVTTRDKMVASTCHSYGHSYGEHSRMYELPLLTEEQSRKLLCKIVFEGPNCSCPPDDLADAFENILRKCGRLPLAIVTLGGLLATKPKERDEWTKLLERIGPMLETNVMLDRMKRVLIIGYNHLPYPIKPCLLYLSIFPEDYEIRRTRLVRLWMAEGFVSRRRGMSAEEVAEDHINELISRSLIQRSKTGDDGRIKTCRVHDIMLEVIASASIEENFVTVFGEHFLETPHGKVRRLSAHDKSTLETDPDISHVRSLMMFRHVEKVLNSSSRMSLLRVLDLEGCTEIKDQDLQSISEFFLLKYLNLRGTSVEKLPKSIGKLQNLETLDIRETTVSRLPKATIKLQKLAYLLGGCKDYDRKGSQFAVPSTTLEMPRGYGSMEALKRLGVINSDSKVLHELGKLTQLRKLILCGQTPAIARQHICDSLQKLSQLRSLSFCDMHSESIDFLDNLSLAPMNLQTLKLVGNLGKLPAWIPPLKEITKITLVETRLQISPVEVLGGFPRLVQLILGWQAYDGEQLSFSLKGFRNLKMLYLDDFAASFEKDSLPNLELLVIKKWNDSAAADISGVKHLKKLKKVDIDIFNFRIKYSLITAVEEHPNHPKLIVR